MVIIPIGSLWVSFGFSLVWVFVLWECEVWRGGFELKKKKINSSFAPIKKIILVAQHFTPLVVFCFEKQCLNM